MSKRLEWTAVIAVFLWAAVLRLGWPGVNSFAFDEARLSLISLDMAQNGHLARVGMPSSAGVPNLPGAAWIFAVPYSFSTDPLVATQFVGLLSLLAVIGVWWLARVQWGRWAGLIAALFLAAAPHSIFFSRNIWSQNLLPLLGVIWLITACNAQSTNSRIRFINIALNVFLAGFALQVHFAGAALALATAYLFIRLRWWREIKPVLAGGIAAIVALLPFISYVLEPDSPVINAFQSTLGGAVQIDLTGFQQVSQLGLGQDWSPLILGGWPAPDGGMVATLGIGLILGAGFIALGRVFRHDRKPSLGELALVLLVVSPIVFIRHSTPVYIHYQLASLPPLALIAGASTRLVNHRFWPRILIALMAAVALIWSAQVIFSLDFAAQTPTPNGLGVPLGVSRAAAYGIPSDQPVLFFGHGDNPDVDGEPAVFGVLWWGRDRRTVNGQSVLILPPEPATLMASIAPFQAWEEITFSQLIGDEWSFPRRGDEFPMVATAYDGAQNPAGFTLIDPIKLDDGTQLEGWRVRWVGSILRISTLWRVVDSVPGSYQQFHHLRTADTLDLSVQPAMISDVSLSAHNWRVGDLVIVMGDFYADATSTGDYWVDVGHYSLSDQVRRPRTDGDGDFIRLGPFRLDDLPQQYQD